MMKKLLIIITLLFSVILNSGFKNVEQFSVNKEEFLKKVKESKYYNQFSDKIERLEVIREAETEYGTRFTIQFTMRNDESINNDKFVFIGDENGVILESLVIKNNEKILSIVDAKRDFETNINIEPKGPVYECVKYTCTRWSHEWVYDPTAACSTIIGQPCNILSVTGAPYSVLICKAGVWFFCNMSLDKVCLKYYETIEVCNI